MHYYIFSEGTGRICKGEQPMNILEEIAAKTAERIRKEKETISLSTVRSAAEKRRLGAPDFLFEKALKKPGVSFICEVKKASPSKGIIAEDFPYLDIARSYEAAGADAISCLTEPFYFLGRDAYLQEISASVSIPVLRKDFTIDEYMIYQAAAYGASAVLLICSILDDEKLLAYRQLADELKLSALVETHSEEEISRAVKAGARIIGVNNRNLKNFQVDVDNSLKLRSLSPKDCLFVSESGIKTRDDIEKLERNGTDAVLIGETLMRAADKKAMLDSLKGVYRVS